MTKLPTLAQVRDDLFAKALQVHGGRVIPAAEAIGVNYATLYRWISRKSSCKVQDGVQ